MKKRLVCLFLCLVMLLSVVLTSCSKKDEEEAKENITQDASDTAITLTMWVVSEEKVSDAAAAAVTEALNAITRPKFKTELVLTYLTEDEYEAKLSATIAAYEEEKKHAVSVETEAPEETETGEGNVVTDETETNKYGQSVIKYPDLVANQVDIIYIAGEDMYIDFIEKGWLAELDTELSSSSKKIKEYVSTTLLSAAKYNGTTYAIPNNRVIGEYTYMLLNKDLMSTYAQDAYAKLDMIDGFYNEYLYTYLELVRRFESDTVIPIDASYDDCLKLLAHYWYVDSANYTLLDKFSLFGYHYDNMADLTRGSTILGYNNLFEDEDFVEDYLQLNRFRMDDYFRKEDDTRTESAIKFVKGSYADIAQYEEDYYSVIVEYPTASSEDIYGNMFGVCTYARNVNRCMDIITYLNTNAEFRNLLQYGVEGMHYKLTENEYGVVTGVERLNNDYMMDLYTTGNMFIAYPDTAAGMTNEVWESGKVQNRSSLVDPLLGFDLAEISATIAPEAETEKISNVGYNLKYSTGYSKDVMMQNEVIAAWINECDATGNGIYVLETNLIEGQNSTVNYYIYNNMGKTSFSVEEDRDVETTVDGEKTIETQTNLDFILTYGPMGGAGYELSMMTIYTKKTNSYELLCKVDGADTPISVKTMDELLTVDLLNTNEYTVDAYDSVTRASFVKNNILYTWIAGIDARHADKSNTQRNKTTNYLMTYETTNEDGKKEYTYVFYRCMQRYETVMNIQPTGDSGKLNLIIDLKEDEESPTDLENAVSMYSLCYIRVTVNDNNIVPKLTLLVNGETASIPEANVTKSDIDPDFTMIGNLDTELVKFMQTLNDDMVAFLESKYEEYLLEYQEAIAQYSGDSAADALARRAALDAAIEKLEVVVREIGYLLTTEAVAPTYSSAKLPNLYDTDLIKKYLVDDNTTEEDEKGGQTLTLLHRYVLNAVSATPLKIMKVQHPENTLIDAYYGGDEKTGEAYVYYDSLYGIYYAWMEKYGYLPKE